MTESTEIPSSALAASPADVPGAVSSASEASVAGGSAGPVAPVAPVAEAPVAEAPVAGAARGGSTRLRGIDGLRALAVAAVVIYHVAPGALPGGGLGVDLFFVISGFLITGLLLRERSQTGGIRLRSFWARRARRLLPALALLVLVCTSVALAVNSLVPGSDLLVGIGRQVLGAATFSSNWLAIGTGSSYFAGTTPELFRNLWSLAVEEQFYLVWPFVVLLVLLARRRRPRVLTFTAVALASALAMAILFVPGTDATRVYYGTDTHSFGLAIGALLAVSAERWPQGRLGWSRWQRRLLPIPGILAVAALIALAVLLPADSPWTFRGGLFVVSLLTAVAIVAAVIPGSALGWMLERPPLRWIGERSYGIYLWHWPVLVLLVAALPGWQSEPVGAWGLGVLAVAITVAAAALSYRYVESPIRSLGFRAWLTAPFRGAEPGRARRVTTALVTAAALVVTAVATGTAVSTAPHVGSAQVDIEAGRVALARSHDLPPAPPGSRGSSITAIGDSVMLAAAPELQQSFPGIAINAVVSRQMNTLPGIVRTLLERGQLRDTLLVGLGTNGFIARDTLAEVHKLIGHGRQLIFVNIQAPRPWEPSVNKILSTYSSDYDNVELADWRSAIAPHLGVLAGDHIHPGPTGGRIYARAVAQALKRLDDRPPYPVASDYMLGDPGPVAPTAAPTTPAPEVTPTVTPTPTPAAPTELPTPDPTVTVTPGTGPLAPTPEPTPAQ